MPRAKGLPRPKADEVAWLAGIAACVGSGLIEFAGSFFLHHLRRVTPLAALLAALAGTCVFVIVSEFLFRIGSYALVV